MLPSIVAVILGARFACGTSIVAIRTPVEVVVGADSLASWHSDASSPIFIEKILPAGRSFFATAKLVADDQGQFDVPRAIRETHQDDQPMLRSIQRFETVILPQLQDVATHLHRYELPYFEREVLNKSMLEVAFFAWEASGPALSLRYFTVSIGADGSPGVAVTRRDCPGDCPTGVVYTALGHHDAIDTALRGNPRFWQRGTVDAVIGLIELEKKAKPRYVGGPITILRITARGPQWIRPHTKLAP